MKTKFILIITTFSLLLTSCNRFNEDIFKEDIKAYDFTCSSAWFSNDTFKAILEADWDSTSNADPFATALFVVDRLITDQLLEPKYINVTLILKGVKDPYIATCDFHDTKKYRVTQNGATIRDYEKETTEINYISASDKLKNIMANEPKVKDYVLTDAGVLYISVLDDGTNRNGLAEYFCQEMKSNKIPVERVKVVKYGSQNSSERDNAYGILLGEAWCN